ncbi:MAG: response regulator [Bryobacteraceae bacterium]
MQPATTPDAHRYILVVDDEPAHAEAVRRAFDAADLDFMVQEVGTLREFRKLVAAHPPEIAIVDLNLPDGKAIEVLVSPPEDGDFPAIVMTSFGSEQVAVAAMKAGALDYVVKSPEAFAAMPRTVERALRQWRALQERKRAEQALRESEERYRVLVATSLDAVLLSTPEGEILAANAAACRMFGYAEEELLRAGRDSIMDTTDPRLQAALEERARTGKFHGEVTMLRSDGTRFPAEISSTFFSLEGQLCRGWVIRDITGRKQAESRERLARETLELLNRPGDGEKTIRDMLAAIKNTMGFEAVAIRLREGDDFPYYATQGFPEKFVLSERFLCARDRAGEILRDGEGKPVLQCMCGNILRGRTNPAMPFFTEGGSFWSNGTTQLLASTETERQADTCNGCNREGYESVALIPLLAGADIIGLLQLNDRRPNRFTLETIHFFEGLGASIGVALARTREAVAREKLQAQFMQAQKMESVGRLAGGVAHDFNNLLTVINGYSQMVLRKMQADDPLRAMVEEVQKAGHRAAALTQQLLAYSRKQVLQPRTLNLDTILREMEPMLTRLVGEDVEVSVNFRAGGARIHADRHQLEQVVMNLAVNSRDAMPGGGKLSIETDVVEWGPSQAQSHLGAHEGHYVTLAVSDSGTGIDKETLEHIFEPFFTTKGPGQGTGLGLSMIQGIVAQSGGYIEVGSQPGHGTEFKIYLPMVEGTETETRPAATVLATGGKETVLVVDDQAEVRAFAAAALEGYGYRVIVAPDAAGALLLCEREHIDLLLTDVVMPNMSGQALAERTAKLRPGMKVLFMSGYTADVMASHGALAEGVELISKPFDAEQLATRVREVLGPARADRPAVLVAENSTPVRKMLSTTLSEAGYAVVEACDGAQALERLRESPAQLALIDVNMPGQGGFDTARAIREERPEVKIVLMSAALGNAHPLDPAGLGVDGLLPVPAAPELLLDAVRRLLATDRH